MKIWVDADACPVAVKEILFRAADRTKIEVILVANRHLKKPKSKFVKAIVVESGFDVADSLIVQELNEGDLVITADIPLAWEVIEKKGYALNPRGRLYTRENIKSKLNVRDFMETLRASGVETGGPPPFGNKEKQLFANNLDKILVRYLTGLK